jgi:peroxiredoxin
MNVAGIVRSLLLLVLSGCFSMLQAQETTEIRIGQGSTHPPYLLLGKYFGEASYRIDSVGFDTTAHAFVFRKAGLKPGLHFIATVEKKLFDFMLEKPGETLIFSGNLDDFSKIQAEDGANRAFFEYQRTQKYHQGKIDELNYYLDLIRKATQNDPKATAELDQKVATQYDSLFAYIRAYTVRNQGSLHAKMLKAGTIPEPPKRIPAEIKGKRNPVYSNWVRLHYWDNYDFKDERLLNSNLYADALIRQLNRFTPPIPDSFYAVINRAVASMPENGAFYRFTLLYLMQQFEMSEAPNADRLFVYLVDHYVKKGKTPFIDQATFLRLEDKADFHRSNLTGNPAPPMTLQDENGKTVSLNQLNAPFTMLVFYSPLCQHCREDLPAIYATYQAYAPKGLVAMAVNTDKEFDYWRKFALTEQMSWYDVADPELKNEFQLAYGAWNLPVIFLLDKDKKILRKRIKAGNLDAVLGYYMK